MEGKSHFSNGVSGIAILKREGAGEGDHSLLLRKPRAKLPVVCLVVNNN